MGRGAIIDMLVPHNPIFVNPTIENLEVFYGEAVIVKLTNGEQTSGEPGLYCLRALKGEADEILLKWAYSSRTIPLLQIAGIAPRHHDTIEELINRQKQRRSKSIIEDIENARGYRKN